MAHAHSSVYAKPATVRIECTGEISIWCGDARISMSPEEAVQLRDDLSRAITEAATAAAKAVQAEGAPA
ncbi:MAG TPA: hypothetical protein VN662_08785 [Rhodanobacteraceae bacterium]|nr:hypothetical protein [Rhodanobacteraceae bacterium]